MKRLMTFTSQKVESIELLSKLVRKQCQLLKLLNGLIKYSPVILRRTLLHSLSTLGKESKMLPTTDIREDRTQLIQSLKAGFSSKLVDTRKTEPVTAISMGKSTLKESGMPREPSEEDMLPELIAISYFLSMTKTARDLLMPETSMNKRERLEWA